MRVRTEARRESILETAAQVFMEAGYEGTSMAEIAIRAGCSKPTLYGYFPSKAELFVSVILQRVGGTVEAAFEELASRVEDDPCEVLCHLGEHFIQVLVAPQTCAFKRLVLGSMTDRADAERFWELGNKLAVETIESYLIAATEAGRLKVGNALVAAQQLLALYDAEIAWGGPLGVPPEMNEEMIRQASDRAVAVFLAAYGIANPVASERTR